MVLGLGLGLGLKVKSLALQFESLALPPKFLALALLCRAFALSLVALLTSLGHDPKSLKLCISSTIRCLLKLTTYRKPYIATPVVA